MKNKKEIFIISFIIIIIIVSLIIFMLHKKTLVNEIDSNTLENINMEIDTDDGDEDIVWSDYEKREIVLDKSLTITEGGIYNLSGTIENGFIKVNTSDDVKLVLKNVNITNNNGPAIYIESANNTLIYLEEGSTNTLIDGVSYTSFEEDVNGTIYSKDDLVFDGTGTLKIKANYEDGIVSKDDLKIINGNFSIDSKDDGIRGKDSVYIIDGSFNIVSGGDAIKSSNDTDEQKGFVKIENGNFNIESTLDGIQAETKMLIQNGKFNIITGGGSVNSSTSNSWGDWRKEPMNYQDTSNVTESAKGIKAGDNLVIEGGEFIFDISDDSIHSNNYVGIKNGNLTISSGDDGIHADTELIIDGGNINIEKSYEGIESAKITINGGNINLVSSDDGINVAGGNDASSLGGRPGQNNFNNNSNNILTINSGNIYVNASGDGIDVNGSGYVNGGSIVVDGPSDSGNGALDYDGEFVVNGGSLLAGGSSGMSQGVSNNSKQYNVSIFFSSNLSSNTKVIIVDSKGNEVISYTGSKSFSSLIISSDKFVKGQTYIIKVNDSEYDRFTISNITTTIGNSMGGGMQKPNGMKPGRW